MHRTICLAAALAFSGHAAAQHNLSYVGDFESGQIQRSSQTKDGFWVKTLPNPQSGTDSISSGDGGFGPDAKADTRVVRDEVVGSETIRPRIGSYFVRSALYYNKSYLGLNSESGKDNPRTGIAMSDPAHRIGYDTEVYLGFSIYVPRNYEHETGVRATRGAIQLLAVKEPNNADRMFFVLEHFVPKGSNKARWFLKYATNDASTNM